jgi:transposase InsO family protein
MHLKVGVGEYYFVGFRDEYSRYLVHHELLLGMDGQTISVAAQAALEKLPKEEKGRLAVRPEIRSDNGSGYISAEFRGVLQEHGLSHHRIRPHCPEENRLVERAYRTLRERLEGEALEDLLSAQRVMADLVRWYNEERLHSALGYLRPADYYFGQPALLHERRRRKLAQARHSRREWNLQIRQLTFPLEAQETRTSLACH